MKRLASIGTLAMVVVVTGCPDATSTTSPSVSSVSKAVIELQSRQTGDPKLTLHPSGFGKRSYAAWKAQEGRQDSGGDGDHALYFQKMVPTPTVAAGVAVVTGVEGLDADAISGLSWEHREDGHCGAGAPRWNLGLESSSGQRYTVFLGCAAAAHTPAGPDDRNRQWIRDSYPGAALEAAVLAQTGLTSLAGVKVRSLLIVFDEGNDLGLPGYVHLDNITVEINGEPTVFTGPMDNGR